MQQPKVTEVHRLSPYAMVAPRSHEAQRPAAASGRDAPQPVRQDHPRR
jgi:hypothetical protein